MQKSKIKRTKKKSADNQFQPIKIIYGIIILAYIFIPTFTPNWKSLDTNTPKFFMTAVLNLAVFIFFLTSGYFKKNPAFFKGFLTDPIGIVYSALLGVTLLSFTQSINILESVLQFSKVFTIFASAFNISMILMYDLRFLRLIIIVMAGLLAFDSISVFHNINKFIEGEIKAITDIKTVYSNKNILASAIFVKLPFALYLFVFEKKWLKWISWLIFTLGVVATFFMATRAFYLGLTVISIFFIIYHLVTYFHKKEREALNLTVAYLVSLLLAYGLFTFTQENLYPQSKKSRHTSGVIDQMATLRNPKTASRLRVDAWRWSWELIKEKPLLGVGTGNWKIQSLKLENQKNRGFIYLYKTHNDFIEITAETGIFGGLLFLSLFLLIAWNFLKRFTYQKRIEDEGESKIDELGKYMFIAAVGMAFYSVDALFNFPADRPEITALFAFFVAAGVATSFQQKIDDHPTKETKNRLLSNKLFLNVIWIIAFIMLAVSTWILYINFQSTKTQRIVYQEIIKGALKEPADNILTGFPFLPQVSVWGEPIETLKARYLINEERNEEAIEVLKNDRSSPWDARRELFLATAYNNLKEYDSAIYYSEKMAELKPNYYRNVQLLASLYERKKKYGKVIDLYNNFLDENKTEPQAWIHISSLYINKNDLEKAFELIKVGLKYNPRDSLIKKQHSFLSHKLNTEPHLPIYNEATELFKNKEYQKTVEKLNEFLEKVPDYTSGYQIRAFCYYHLKDTKKSIADADYALKLGSTNAGLINLRGVCKLDLKDTEGACKDFKRAMDMGDKSGESNLKRFCQKK